MMNKPFSTAFLLAILPLLFSAQLKAQTSNPYVPKVVGPSPNAASLQKFGDIPVSPYTGTVDVSVPIYTIQARGVSVPINLSYHTGGIRLSEEAGWVGLGWALNAGGMISRSIMDKDDFGSAGSYFTSQLPQPKGQTLLPNNSGGTGTLPSLNEYNFFATMLS